MTELHRTWQVNETRHTPTSLLQQAFKSCLFCSDPKIFQTENPLRWCQRTKHSAVMLTKPTEQTQQRGSFYGISEVVHNFWRVTPHYKKKLLTLDAVSCELFNQTSFPSQTVLFETIYRGGKIIWRFTRAKILYVFSMSSFILLIPVTCRAQFHQDFPVWIFLLVLNWTCCDIIILAGHFYSWQQSIWHWYLTSGK